MGSADIRSSINYISQEKSELESIKSKLSGKTISSVSLSRDTEGMGGTAYKEQHEEVENMMKDFVSSVEKEKESAIEALESKINELDSKIALLEIEYKAAVTAEAAAAAAAKKAIEDAKKQAEKNTN